MTNYFSRECQVADWPLHKDKGLCAMNASMYVGCTQVKEAEEEEDELSAYHNDNAKRDFRLQTVFVKNCRSIYYICGMDRLGTLTSNLAA